ncbi:MAG: calcium-binding protein [Phenylobacterium sp.]
MTTYAFETITAQQALNIQVGDYLTFAGGPASRVSVSFSPAELPLPARIVITFEGRTVAFGTELSGLSQRGALEMADGSLLRIGGEASDHLFGGDRHDGLYGGKGNDSLSGGRGDDRLQGNQGNDELNGGAGSNTLHGGKGDDVIYASAYGETRGSWAHGNQGNDEVIGGAGADTLYGGQGNDFLGAKEGDDFLNGDLGDDDILTGDGDDIALGGAGNDTLNSSGGHDVLAGGDGNDMLVAYGQGSVLFQGGAGNDTIVSASHEQALIYGGEGRDQFEFIANRGGPIEGSDDVIADWSADDRFYFAEVSIYSILPEDYAEYVVANYDLAHAIAYSQIRFAGAQYVVTQVGEDLLVFADTDGNSENGADIAIKLIGRTLADISLQNFA